jgi:hypothetical protein
LRRRRGSSDPASPIPTASPSSISVNRAMATDVGARRGVPTLRVASPTPTPTMATRVLGVVRRAARAMSSAMRRREPRARATVTTRAWTTTLERANVRARAWTTPARRTYARERGRASEGGKNRPRANDEVGRGRGRRGEARRGEARRRDGRARGTRGTDDETGARTNDRLKRKSFDWCEMGKRGRRRTR